MKFVGEVLGNVHGIQNFYIAGLVIFMSLFIIMVYRTIKIPKKDLVQFKNSIFETEDKGLKGTNSNI